MLLYCLYDYLITGRQIGKLSHNDIDGDFHVVRIEMLRCFLATEQIDHQFEHGVRGRRFVIEYLYRVLYKIEMNIIFF